MEVLTPPLNKTATTSNVQKLLRTIMGTGEGLPEASNLAMRLLILKRKEKAELLKKKETHVGYSFDTDNLETVDILYEKDKQNRVSGIELDIYMNTDASNDSLKNELTKQFTTLYGQPVANAEIPTWEIKPKGKVSIKVVKNKLDRGLEVKFTQSTKSI
ncbi:MAG: hypothetical protein U5M51_11930 [Emticicia sp.]|nr:hypothetical protein [Emticicia sp.]